jgi:broad specificity phosphatase PhoE
MLLFYIRHGDPIYNPDQLTPLGERQAEAIGKRLAVHGVDTIYSSTSNRAFQTAQPLAQMLKKEVTQLDFMNEGHAWNNMTYISSNGKRGWMPDNPEPIEIILSDEMRKYDANWYDHPEFKKYGYKAYLEQTDKNIDDLLASHGYIHNRENGCFTAENPTEERIAIFAHAGFGSVFFSSLLGIPYHKYSLTYDMCHTGMTVVEFKKFGNVFLPKLLTFSSDAHLYKEGLPTAYNNRIRF